jgi:hypothetical protein
VVEILNLIDDHSRLLVAHRDVRIVTEDGELLRSRVLDPTRDCQRQSG